MSKTVKLVAVLCAVAVLVCGVLVVQRIVDMGKTAPKTVASQTSTEQEQKKTFVSKTTVISGEPQANIELMNTIINSSFYEYRRCFGEILQGYYDPDLGFLVVHKNAGDLFFYYKDVSCSYCKANPKQYCKHCTNGFGDSNRPYLVGCGLSRLFINFGGSVTYEQLEKLYSTKLNVTESNGRYTAKFYYSCLCISIKNLLNNDGVLSSDEKYTIDITFAG